MALPAEVDAQVLINFTDVLPEGFERFQRVVELVDQHPEGLVKSRERFRQYRERGLTPETHKL
jgi:DNA polymerase-3 subunit chi